MEWQSRKLDWKQLGPFTIIECIGTQAYRLELPKSMKIHPVFHVVLLERYKQSDIPGRACVVGCQRLRQVSELLSDDCKGELDREEQM